MGKARGLGGLQGTAPRQPGHVGDGFLEARQTLKIELEFIPGKAGKQLVQMSRLTWGFRKPGLLLAYRMPFCE